MKRLYKAAMFIVVVAVTALPLIGCNKKSNNGIIVELDGNDKNAPSTTVTFFGYKIGAIDLVAIETAIHDFMDVNPSVEVTYEGLKGLTYWRALEKRSSSGLLDDIFNVDHDHLKILHKENKLKNLSGLSTIGNYSSLARSQFTEDDGSVYFLPISIATYGLYVNLDMLKRYGMAPPANLRELAEICEYFTGKGIAPIIINNFNSFRSIVVANSLYPVYQKENPVAEIDKFNKGEVDLAETLRPGIELAASMLERGWIDGKEGLKTAQTSDDLVLFAKGDRPFMISGGWASPRLRSMEPGFAYAIYPLPVLDDGSVLVMEMATCISINAESSRQDDAEKFVEFLTQTSVMWQYCDSQSAYTPMNDDRIPTDPTIAPSTPCLSNGRIVIGSDFKLDLPLDSALRECGIRMMRGISVDDAMVLLSELLIRRDEP